MTKPEEYGISVRLVREDGENLYEARVQELPDILMYGETYAEAYEKTVDIIKTTQDIFAKKGKALPEVQRADNSYSGRITLRMSKSLHRSASLCASRDEISLNQWIVEAVSYRLSSANAVSQPVTLMVLAEFHHLRHSTFELAKPVPYLKIAEPRAPILNYTTNALQQVEWERMQ